MSSEDNIVPIKYFFIMFYQKKILCSIKARVREKKSIVTSEAIRAAINFFTSSYLLAWLASSRSLTVWLCSEPCSDPDSLAYFYTSFTARDETTSQSRGWIGKMTFSWEGEEISWKIAYTLVHITPASFLTSQAKA